MVRIGAVVAAAASVLVLAGCAATSSPPIVTTQQGNGIRTQLQGQARTAMELVDDSASVPDVGFGRTVSDHDWAAASIACMGQHGFRVDVVDGQVEFEGGTGTQSDYARARYACTLAAPRVSAIAAYLDRAQLGALYDYYTGFVVPCLQLAGARTTAPPERQVFIDRFFLYEWHPFDVVWASDPHAADLERTCDPVPPWLDLGD